MIFPKADFHMVRSSMVGQKANGTCQHKTHCRLMAKGHVLAAAARHTAHRDNLLRFSISVTENKALFTPFLQSASLPAGKPLPIQDAHFSLFHPKIDYLNMLSLFSFCFFSSSQSYQHYEALSTQFFQHLGNRLTKQRMAVIWGKLRQRL